MSPRSNGSEVQGGRVGRGARTSETWRSKVSGVSPGTTVTRGRRVTASAACSASIMASNRLPAESSTITSSHSTQHCLPSTRHSALHISSHARILAWGGRWGGEKGRRGGGEEGHALKVQRMRLGEHASEHARIFAVELTRLSALTGANCRVPTMRRSVSTTEAPRQGSAQLEVDDKAASRGLALVGHAQLRLHAHQHIGRIQLNPAGRSRG